MTSTFWTLGWLHANPQVSLHDGCTHEHTQCSLACTTCIFCVGHATRMLITHRDVPLLILLCHVCCVCAVLSCAGLSFSLQASTAASHVLLTSPHLGYFSDNAVTAVHPCLPQTVTFYPHSSVQQLTPDALLSSLKVESLFNHQFGSAGGGGNGGGGGGGGDGGWGWWPKRGGDQGPSGSASSAPAQGSSRVFHAGSAVGKSPQPTAPAQ